MCSGSGIPGSSTELSGNSGMSTATGVTVVSPARDDVRKLQPVLRRLDFTAATPADLRRALPRARVDVQAAVEAVAPVVADVAARGYPAARAATLRFDGVDVAEPRVPEPEPAAALDALAPEVRAGLAESIRRAQEV